jgi:hypothetical protein
MTTVLREEAEVSRTIRPNEYVVETPGLTYTVIVHRDQPDVAVGPTDAALRNRHVALILGVALVSLLTLNTVLPTDLGVLGLASALPITFFLGLTALIVGFSVVVVHHPQRSVLGAYVSAVAILLHGLHPLVYEYLTYPWAWKHIGVVEFIQRTGGVDRSIEVLGAYHNWPGFFALNALITDLGGAVSPHAYAAWSPILFNLLFITALYLVFRRFTSDERTIAVALMIFTIGNWVGQDYFAPQAVAYFLYLVIVAALLNWFLGGRAEIGAAERQAERPVIAGVLVVVVGAVAVTHQLTPIMMIIVLFGLTFLGGLKARWLFGATIAITGVWLATFALPFVADYLPKVVDDLRNIGGRVDDGLIDYSHVDLSQRVVSLASRGLTAGVLGLAFVGFIRHIRGLAAGRQAIVLGAAPLILVVASSYGDEIVFRAYLFVLPIAALFAGALWFPPWKGRKARFVLPTLGATLFGLSLLALVAMFGNDSHVTFTADEVAAATIMYDMAVPDSTVVQLTNDYPTKFKNYENLAELDVASFSDAAKDRFLSDPAFWFKRWLAEEGEGDGFVLITRSQIADAERLGLLSTGSSAGIVDRLRRSDDFEILFDRPDASLFVVES